MNAHNPKNQVEMYVIELKYQFEFKGTITEAQEFADTMSDAVYDWAGMWCGNPVCCPGPEPTTGYPTSGAGSSSIDPLPEEEK